MEAVPRAGVLRFGERELDLALTPFDEESAHIDLVSGAPVTDRSAVATAITSTEGGTGLTASAAVNVEAPPAISKSFAASSRRRFPRA